MIQNVPLTRCTCGQLYFSEGWARTELVGYVPSGRDAAGEVLELRICESCGERLYLDCGEHPESRAPSRMEHLADQISLRRISLFPITLPSPSMSIPPGH